MTGALKAKVNGLWTPVTYGGNLNEVEVSGTTPTDAGVELWYDTSTDQTSDPTNYWNSAWGVIAEARWTSSWTSISTSAQTITAATGTNTFTVFLYASRRYRLYWQGMVTSTVAADYVVLQHQINGGLHSENNAQYIAAANVQYFTWVESRYIPPADGNYTFTMTGRRSSASTGTVSVINTGNNPLWLMVEDMGPIVRAGVNPPVGQAQVTTAGNAIGIIAKAAEQGPSGAVTCPASASTPLYEALTVMMSVGRRYRIVCNIRALSGAPTSSVNLNFTGLPQAQNDAWQIVDGSYRPLRSEYYMDGDGTSRTIRPNLVASAGATITAYVGEAVSGFYIEDCGPNSYPALPPAPQPTPWSLITTFLNGWTNYDSAAIGGWQQASYRKVGDEVQLRGLLAGGTIGQAMFTLPVGYRPPSGLIFACDGQATAHVRIDVQVGGNVLPNNGSNGYMSIAGIRFSVTP